MTSREITLGKIVGVFGVKGWVKIQSECSPIDNIFKYRSWTLHLADGSVKPIQIKQGKTQGKGLVAALEGVADRDQAREYMGAVITVSADQLPELEDGEYYWHQLEGLNVVTLDSIDLGTVDHLMETGANDVIVVKPTGQSLDQRERLIPYLPDQVIKSIDLDQRQITVDWDPDF